MSVVGVDIWLRLGGKCVWVCRDNLLHLSVFSLDAYQIATCYE